MKQILVLGSLNVDLVQQVPRLSVAGETMRGEALRIFVGGKGANQACAAGRLGGSVRMAGCVGDDVLAARLTGELQAAGVDITGVRTHKGPSGTAVIFVLPNGENSIVIAAGANGAVTPEMAVEAAASLREGDLLLCQLEIPIESVEAAFAHAHANGVTTVLDPAPAAELPPALLRTVTILTPNQTEAALLAHQADAPSDMSEAQAVARKLQENGPRTVIVKMGAAGCLIADGDEAYVQPGFRVQAVDTTAAGDTFNGALAVALAKNLALPAAARYANAAAALSVTKPGALASVPTAAEVLRFLDQQS